MAETSEEEDDAAKRGWFGHPRQLALLFTTEAWERFGYYGMRALLVLYLVQHFVFSDQVANGLYGAFTSLVYLTPIIGGYLADRYLGAKKAVRFGAVLMAAGYFMLALTGGERAAPFVVIDGQSYAVQSQADTQYVIDHGVRRALHANAERAIALDGASGALAGPIGHDRYRFDAARNPLSVALLFVSLGLVVVGNGYFKPNISNIVGQLYSAADRRRDAGFTIFYMGINIGSIVSQFLAPIIAVMYGYGWGFGLAGAGMLFAAIRFHLAGGQLSNYGNPPGKNTVADLVIIAASILAVPALWFLFSNAMDAASASSTEAAGILGYILAQPLLGKIMFGAFILAMVGLPIWASFALPAEGRDKLIVIVVLSVFSVVFWTLFEQAGSSLTLFAERNTDRVIGGYTMPAGQAQTFNPLFVVLLAPAFSLLWNWLGRRDAEPSVPLKFALGLALVGAGFLVLVFGAQFHNSEFRVPLFWLALAYFIHTLGELCLSPVGLSMVSKLSPLSMVSLMMGVWFLSSSMAQYVGGVIAQFASTETVAGQVLDPSASLQTYRQVFQAIGIAGIVSSGLLLLFSPFLRKAMHGIR